MEYLHLLCLQQCFVLTNLLILFRDDRVPENRFINVKHHKVVKFSIYDLTFNKFHLEFLQIPEDRLTNT